MELADIQSVVFSIRGCTFASLDAETMPSPGIRKITLNEQVVLFNSTVSGYEQMVRRRLQRIGRSADFTAWDLPFGRRIGTSPLIEHQGKMYLQTILLNEGYSRCYIQKFEVHCSEVQGKRLNNQGLPYRDQVQVRTYLLSSIKRLRLMGKTFIAS